MCKYCDNECTCHVSPPCSYCTTHVVCEVCGKEVCIEFTEEVMDKTDGS